jgi:hypothetical protein
MIELRAMSKSFGPAQEFFGHPKTERARQFLRQFSADYTFQI